MTGSSDPGETNDSQISPSIPVTPQAASSESEETKPAAEAELKLDYSPNPGNKPQYEEFRNPQVYNRSL